jgi:polyphosphate kinase
MRGRENSMSTQPNSLGILPSEASTAKPAPAATDFDLNSPQWYLNRELTWLEFNRRVLHEAEDARIPLLERLKFLAIVSSNLDEFFMKRIGGLKEQLGAGVQELTIDGRTPRQQLEECGSSVRAIETRKDELLPELLKQLQQHGIFILNYRNLSADEQKQLRGYYLNNIFPLVTPQSVDPAHPFPFISNLSLNLLVALRHPKENHSVLARVKVPLSSDIRRFLRLGNSHRYVRLEDVMANNLYLLFPVMDVEACELFHVTRNANTERDETNADDLLALIEAELRTRKFAHIVRIVVQSDMDPGRRARLAMELGLNEAADVFEREGMFATRDLMELAGIEIPQLHYPPHYSIDHPRLEYSTNIFDAIREAGSILLHHPYETFTGSVERFLQEASSDPQVLAIKMTIYRTSSDARIIQHLIDAARNGKQVAVAVELKARFDEAANIRWANRLEEAGIHVTYGVVGLKTHCKVILVIRRDYNGLCRYAHIGTGNYHAGTARIYTDLGLLTSDPTIGSDLTELFNYLTTGYASRRNYQKILPAPASIKKTIIDKIHREIAHCKSGKPARIQFKMNALEDAEITRELYLASQAGVKIELIVRDSCRLRPGIPWLSDNITVLSIVGRFLEHSRIYYFHNSGDEEYYIGSADMMMRNLEQRVEVLVPVEEPELRKELRAVLDINLSDRRSAWEMQSDGRYLQRQPGDGDPRSCQERLMELAQAREQAARKTRKKKSDGQPKRRKPH